MNVDLSQRKILYSQFWPERERYTKAWGEISKTKAKEKDAKFKTEVLLGTEQKNDWFNKRKNSTIVTADRSLGRFF